MQSAEQFFLNYFRLLQLSVQAMIVNNPSPCTINYSLTLYSCFSNIFLSLSIGAMLLVFIVCGPGLAFFSLRFISLFLFQFILQDHARGEKCLQLCQVYGVQEGLPGVSSTTLSTNFLQILYNSACGQGTCGK